MRVKPHVQIAIELVAVELINSRERKNVSASDAMWQLIQECRPAIAKKAIEQAREEGHKVSADLSDSDK